MRSSYIVGEQTKQRILEISTSLFYKHGFQKTTYDHISKQADVNRALIPYYFKNKKNLGLAVYDNTWAKVSRACWQIIGNCSPEVQVCVYLFAYYRILTNPNYARFLSEINHEESCNPKMIEGEKNFFGPIIHKYRRIEDDEFNILAQMDFGIEKEIVQMAYECQDSDRIDQMAVMELNLILNYAGYPQEEVDSIVHDALQYLSHYTIQLVDDFNVDITRNEP